LRAWNYFEFDNLGGGTRPPTPAPAPTPEPELRCDQCTSNGFAADECGCGVCGSFGGCSFSCDVDESAGRPGAREILKLWRAVLLCWVVQVRETYLYNTSGHDK
jgi:hypothetical protein